MILGSCGGRFMFHFNRTQAPLHNESLGGHRRLKNLFAASTVVSVVSIASIGINVGAETEKKVGTPSSTSVIAKKSTPLPRTWNIRLGYFSWQEQMSLTNGGTSDKAVANFLGSTLSAEWEKYFLPRHGTALEFGLGAGTANGGGTQSTLTYGVGSNISWTAGFGSYRYAYRFSTRVTTSVGPLLLFRQLTWPSDPTGTRAESGSSFNYGAVADLRFNVTNRWEVRQMIGTLLQNASTAWSMSIGYKF